MKNNFLTKEEIRTKVEDREFRKRCIAAYICPTCGQDFKDQSASSSHWTELACPNKKCSDYGVVKKSWN